ncbi:MAG: hypothetical protein ACI4NU_03525 [Christensenellales bacterium]
MNNGVIFIRAVKVRRTFNIMSPFPGEGGKGDGVLRFHPKFLCIRRKAKHGWRKKGKRENEIYVAKDGVKKMEQMRNTNTAEEELRAIRQSCEVRRRYALVQMLALVAMAAVVIAVALTLLPRANAALSQVEAVAEQLASVDLVGMAERVDALVVQSSESMDEAMAGLDAGLSDLHRALDVVTGVDLESLNESIESLSAILEPLSRLFGKR